MCAVDAVVTVDAVDAVDTVEPWIITVYECNDLIIDQLQEGNEIKFMTRNATVSPDGEVTFSNTLLTSAGDKTLSYGISVHPINITVDRYIREKYYHNNPSDRTNFARRIQYGFESCIKQGHIILKVHNGERRKILRGGRKTVRLNIGSSFWTQSPWSPVPFRAVWC